MRHATGTFSRKKLKGLKVEGAPYSQGALIAGRYLVKDAIGAGPHGHVFRAQDKEIDVEVAIKVVTPKLVQTPDERRAFSKEIRLARKLSHQHLVRVYEDGEDQERPYFTMQYLDGLPLRRIIDLRKEKGQHFKVREVDPILSQIAAALDSAHKVGPHSDVRPENVIILPDLLKLTDFGLGLAIPRRPFANALKASRADAYLAPEYLHDGEVDGRADVYALGVLVGEMLAGVLPDGVAPSLRALNPEVPERIDAVYQRAVNPNALARFTRPTDLAGEFSEIAKTLPPPRPPSVKRPPAPEAARPRPTPMAAAPAVTGQVAKIARKPPPPPPEAIREPSNGSKGPAALEIVQPLPPPPVPSSEAPFLAKAQRPDSSRGSSPGLPAVEPRAAEPQAHRRPESTTRGLPLPRPLPRRRSRKSTAWLVGLIVVGVGAGAGGGVFILDLLNQPPEGRTAPPAPPPPVAEVPRPVEPPKPIVPPPPTAEELAKRAEQERIDKEAKAAEEEKKRVEDQEAERKRAEEARIEEEKKLAEEEKKKKAEEAKKRAETRKLVEAPRKPREPEHVAERPPPEPEKPLPRAPAVAVATPEERGEEEAAPVKQAGGTCPAGTKLIAAGSFRMGSSKDDPMMGFDEKALAVTETADYCIDLYEWPNQRGATPKSNVSYNQAEQLCRGKGKRLCTEEEWERACKGTGGSSRYPYGAAFDPDACNTRDADDADRMLAESGRFSRCRSGWGVSDLSGNLSEWTGTRFGPDVTERAVKGGAFNRPDYDTRCATRKPTSPDTREAALGFRCCADPR